MLQHDKLEFDKKMHEIAYYMVFYNFNPKMPDDMQFLMESDEEDNKETGFYAQAFLYNDKVIISMQETFPGSLKDIYADIDLANDKLSQQYFSARKFYEQVLVLCKARDIDPENIVFTGYSLGGSLTQIMCKKTGLEGVAFAPFGTRHIIENDLIINVDNIPNKKEVRNYGNINDLVYYANIDYHIGKVYFIDTNENETKPRFPEYHFLNHLKNLEDFSEYNAEIHKKFGDIDIIPALFRDFSTKPFGYANMLASKVSNKFSYVYDQVVKPTFELIYNGINVTKEFLPYIKEIIYTDFLEDECDELDIVLNVTDDLLLNSWYPDKAGVLVCNFICGNDILNCGTFSISENKLLSAKYGDFLIIRALAIPVNLALRTIRTDYYEKCTLFDIVRKVAERYNFKVVVPEIFDDFKVDRINQVEETDLGFLHRISKEYGYIFKLTFNEMYFLKMNEYIPIFNIDKSVLKELILNDSGIEKYKGCQINYYNPEKKKLMSVSKGDMSGDILKIRKKFTSMEEGNILAEAILERADLKEITGDMKLKESKADFISGVSFSLSDYGMFNGIYRIRKSVHTLSSDGWATSGKIEKVA